MLTFLRAVLWINAAAAVLVWLAMHWEGRHDPVVWLIATASVASLAIIEALRRRKLVMRAPTHRRPRIGPG